MKKQILSFALLLVATISMAQNSNCAKIKTLIAEANNKQMQSEAAGDKFKTSDDMDAWKANTTLDGASRCYVQDANVAKMYVAEFGTSAESKSADPALSKKLNDLAKMFNDCLGTGFKRRDIKSSENIFPGYQYDGTGVNANTRIMLMMVYNPGDSKQLLFVSIINDAKK